MAWIDFAASVYLTIGICIFVLMTARPDKMRAHFDRLIADGVPVVIIVVTFVMMSIALVLGWVIFILVGIRQIMDERRR